MTKIPSVKIRNHYMCRAGHRGKYKNWQHQDGSFGSTIQESLNQKEEIFWKQPIQVFRVQLQGPAPGSRVRSHPSYSGSPTQHKSGYLGSCLPAQCQRLIRPMAPASKTSLTQLYN